jgi:hypothetical protein
MRRLTDFRETIVRHLVFGVLLTALLVTPTSADKEQWSFVRSGSEALLVYGVPESDVTTLSFICEPKRRSIDIVTTELPKNVKGERPGRVKLTNAVASLEWEFAGKTSRADEDRGIHFSAPSAIDTRLFDLLENGTSLRIEAMDARDSVPLAQIRKPLAQMRQACR